MKHRTNRGLLFSLTFLSAFSLTAVAHAEGDSGSKEGKADASAADHAKRAQIAYDIQDWPTAAREYEAAYKAEQKPEYLWGLAQTHRLSGKFADAIRTYKAFQRAGVSPNQSNAAEMMITKCEAEQAKEEAKQAQAARQEKSAVAAPTPAPAPKSPEQDSAKSSGGLPIGWFVTGAVVTVAVGATAIWSGLDTRAKAADYEDKPTREGYLDGKDLEKRTNFLLGATAVAGVATTVVAIFTDWSGGPKQGSEQRALRVHPAVAHDGGALFFSGAF